MGSYIWIIKWKQVTERQEHRVNWLLNGRNHEYLTGLLSLTGANRARQFLFFCMNIRTGKGSGSVALGQ